MRVLYLMHVDWRWIRQRPHRLAEELTRRHEVLVLYRPSEQRWRWPRNDRPVRRLPLLPLGIKGRLRERLEPALQRAWVSAIARAFRPELVWLTAPQLDAFVPAGLRDRPTIYDCMDDVTGFCADEPTAARERAQEHALVQRSALVLCSSERLRRLMAERHGVLGRAALLRNAVGDEFLVPAPAPFDPGGRAAPDAPGRWLDVAYVGTISAWLDHAALLHCLDRMPSLRVHLIGPVHGAGPPRHERLVLHGPVEHGELPRRVAGMAALLMPFVVGPLVEAVDPVKLYEYLAFGKEVLTCRYAEIDRFGPYVHFYRTPADLLRLLGELHKGTIPQKAGAASAFLAENTWSARGRTLDGLLRGLA